MEEIVSTEPLEKEILSDARKKAERSLIEAGAEAERIGAASNERSGAALAALEAEYESRARRYREESLARLPLEKARIKAAHIDSLLRAAIKEGLDSLGKEERDRLFVSLLKRASPYLAAPDRARRVELRYFGLPEAEAREIASKALPGVELASLSEDPSIGSTGLLASTGDLSARATLELVGERLLDEKRGELAAALCGKALSL